MELTTQRRMAFAALASALSILSHEPFGLWFLGWFSLVPLFVALDGVKPREGLRYGMFYGFCFYMASLVWMVEVFSIFGLILPLIPAIFAGLFGVLYSGVRIRFPKLAVLIAPVIWTGLELFRSELYFLRFSWLSPAYSQYRIPVMIQVASLAGCYGLSFLMVLFNSLVAEIVLGYKKRQWKKHAIPAGSIIIFTVGFGIISVGGKWDTGLSFAGIQSEDGYRSCIEMTRERLSEGKKPDIVIWPEYSSRNYFGNPVMQKEIGDLVRRHGVHLLFGTTEDFENGNFANTAAMVDDKGGVAGRWIKAQPVQFFCDGIVGRSRGPIKTRLGTFGVFICYDLGYPEFIRKVVSNGAEAILVPTMDKESWGSWEHCQAASVATFRAVETRRWVVRIVSSGVSMLVRPDGGIVKELGYGKRGVMDGEFGLEKTTTIYVLFGYLFAYVCLGITALVIIYIIVVMFIGSKGKSSMRTPRRRGPSGSAE